MGPNKYKRPLMPQNDQNTIDTRAYLKSLGLQGDIEKISFKEALNQALDDSKNNFVDGICHRPWCQSMDECLWVSLRNLQNQFSEYFFDHNLAEEDLLINDVDFIRFATKGCYLPETYYERASLENKSIAFVLELMQALIFCNLSELSLEDLSEEDARLKAFGQDLYKFLLYSLHQSELSKRPAQIDKLKAFLSENQIFDREDSNDFLMMAKNI